MTPKELTAAKALLVDRVERFETATRGDGQCLTAHWIDGGQTLFYTLRDVCEWLRERQRAECR